MRLSAYHRFLLLAGILPLLLVFPLYRPLQLVFTQAGLMRMLALAGMVALILAGGALILAASTVRVELPQRLTWGLRFVAYLGVMLNLVAFGLAIFYVAPVLAPLGAKAVAAVILAVLVLRYLSLPSDGQRFILGSLARLGLLMMLVPVAASPWILHAFLTFEPHLAQVPTVPRDAKVRADAPRRVVLVTFDAMRARSTSLGAPDKKTPHLAALAGEATVFSNCRAAGERTQVSMATVLTGIRPYEVFPHVRNRSGYLSSGFVPGLGTYLAPAGFKSYYVTMKVGPDIFGLDGEFERGKQYVNFLPSNRFNTPSFVPWREVLGWLKNRNDVSSTHTNDRKVWNEVAATRKSFETAQSYLAEATSPVFVWIHIGAPHTPYYDVPEADLDGELTPARYRRFDKQDVLAATPAQLKELEQVYERYIRFIDHEFGRFMADLRQSETWKDTMVVVTADHGESFTADERIHGFGIPQEDIVHVPLMVHEPGQTAGAVSPDLVGHEDVTPTILQRVYQTSPEGFVGRPLLPLSPLPERTLYSWALFERYTEWETPHQSVAAYQGRFKYLRFFSDGRERLYDLETDPRATQDVSQRHPGRLKALSEQMDRDLKL